MKFSLIIAMSENNCIGKEGDLPWKISGDLKLVKEITMGHCLVMGRKTHESIGRVLPGRVHVVLTRKKLSNSENLYFVQSKDEVFKVLQKLNKDQAFVFGGAEIYKLFLNEVTTIFLTRVHAQINGDTYFNEFSLDGFELVQNQTFNADEKNEYEWTFQKYKKN